jgi:hypothetical protein
VTSRAGGRTPAAAEAAEESLCGRTLNVGERYVELAFRLAKHKDELVFGYCGPQELRAGVEAEEVLPPARLADDVRALLSDLDGDDQRTRWLRSQTTALLVLAEKLDGSELSYRDEVRRCYEIEPEWYQEEEFQRAHDALDEVLPGDGDLATRMARWFRALAIPKEKLRGVLAAMIEDFRRRTRELVGLPDGEETELRIVSGKRWGGYCEVVGDRRSIVHVNTDVPMAASDLPYFVAHEVYPGHHSEHAWKKALLVDELGQVEVSIILASGSESTVAEGLAELAPQILLGDDAHDIANEHLAPIGLAYDAEVGKRVQAVQRIGSDVASNLALMLHERGASEEELKDYARRWTLRPEEHVERLVRWVSTQPFRGYVVTYPAGLRLAREFVQGNPARFKRLLTEQLVPADLAAG